MARISPLSHGGTPKPRRAEDRARAGMPTRDMDRRRFLAFAGSCLGISALGTAGCADALFSTELVSTQNVEQNENGSAATTIRFGCEAAFAPYEWRQDNETEWTLPVDNAPGTYVDGYDIQLMKRIAEGMGREPVVIDMSFDGLIAALNAGQFDALIAGMSATPERAESVDFSHPYQKSDVGIFVSADSPYAGATELADLSGASVIAQRGSIQDAAIDDIPGVNHMNPANSVPDAMTRLMQGTVDGVAIDEINANIYEAQYPGYVCIRFEEGRGFAPNPGASVAVAKGDPEGILDAINQVIDSISEEERQQMWDEASARVPE